MGEEELTKEDEEGSAKDRFCDFCGDSKALVYCRADSASLCLACDRQVHAANSVSSKHPRSLLCDACRSAPSSIYCCSHGRILCSSCDFEVHRSGGPHQDRRPVESFSGCPAAVELVSVLGVGGDEKAVVKGDDDKWSLLEERWVWETPQVVRLDDLIVPNSSCHGFQAMGIPPLPKNRNSACGKQKEEILRQLCELIKSETHLTNDGEELDPVTELQSLLPHQNVQQENMHSDFDGDAVFMGRPSCEDGNHQWNLNDWHEADDPVSFPYNQPIGSSSTVIASFPDGIADFQSSASPAGGGDRDPAHHTVGENLSLVPPKGRLDLACPDRDSVISRYKEKRKTRRYDKLIRYESRKARADSRMRIKGRFAKTNQEPKS